jgi:Trypsin
MNSSIMVGRKQGSLLLVAAALCLAGCGGVSAGEAQDDVSAAQLEADAAVAAGLEEEVGTQTSELKNGTLFDGSGQSRGAVLLEVYWPTKPRGFWQKCSGQIVSKQTILTAAHCLYGVKSGEFTWVRASRQTSAGWVDVIPSTWTQVRWNQAYDGRATNDVGVVIAPDARPLIGYVAEDAAIMAKTTPNRVPMTAFGFGYYTDTLYDGKGRSATIVPNYDPAVPDFWFDVTAGGPQMCSVDSGGPLKSTHNGLFLTYGVFSWGAKAVGECRRNGHWATTAHNITWLKSNIVPTANCFETATLLTCR